jgi:protein-S-isoprenylcysteine O-methyltransferase Ste14
MNFLFEFSFAHCIAICAFLVPANLLLTLWTILLARQGHSPIQTHLVMLAASLAAFILLLHDFTWFAIGVVMAPTYILLVLGCVCLSLNLWAIAYSNRGTFAGTGIPAQRNDATA